MIKKLQIILILLGIFFLSGCVNQKNFIKKHNETYEEKAERIVKKAESLLNTSKKKFDCSKFVQCVFFSEGINLPRTSREQVQIGEKISYDNLKKGDLVFFTTIRKGVSHVGIYLEDNKFIHVSSKKKKVSIDKIFDNYYHKRFIEGRRVIK